MNEGKAPTVAYRNIFSKEESLLILDTINKLEFDDALVGYIPDGEKFNFNKKLSLSKNRSRVCKRAPLPDNHPNSWIYERIIKAIHEANATFYKHQAMSFPTFEILEYTEGGKFEWHMDSGLAYPYTERLLSIIVFLSERTDYEGGTLEFMPKLIHNLKFEQGDIIIFPSHIIHRVTPVTQGLRRTLVTWGYKDGTKFGNNNLGPG